MAGTIKYTTSEDGTVGAILRSPLGYKLTVSGTLDAVEPVVGGHDPMLGNPALVHNAWAFAKHETIALGLDDGKDKNSHHKQAKAHATVATEIAELAESVGDVVRNAWCSGCFTKAALRS